MGWSIGVQEHSSFSAACGEIGCTERFPSRSTWHEANLDVAAHRRWHQELWAEQERQWDADDRGKAMG